jgi:hypothetical protein
MSPARIALYCSGFLLLCLLGVGIYAYLNLPSLVERQAQRYLHGYGVQEFDLEGLQFAHDHLRTDSLHIHGEFDGLTYEATLSRVELSYRWRMLFDGGLASLTLDQLDISADGAARKPGTAPGSVNIEQILPQSFLAMLPLQAIEVKQWNVEYRSPETQPLSANGHLQLTNRQDLALSVAQGDSHITARFQAGGLELPLTGQISLHDAEHLVTEFTARMERADRDEWQWVIEGELQHAPALAWLHGFRPEALDMSALKNLALKGSSEFRAQIRHPNALSLADVDGQSAFSQFDVAISTQNSIAQLHLPPGVAGISGNVGVAAGIEDGRVELTIAPTQLAGTIHTGQLRLPADMRRWLLWDEVIPISWRNPDEITLLVGDDQTLSLQLRDAVLVLGGEDTELRAESMNVDALFQGDPSGQLSATLSARLNSRMRKQALPQMKLALAQQGSLEHSELRLTLNDTAESMSLDLRGKLNLETGSGSYELVANSRDLPYATRTVLPLLHKFELLQQDVKISSGTLSLSSQLTSETWDVASVQQQSALVIDKLSGNFEDYSFEGITLDAQWSGVEQWKTLRPAEFAIAKLNTGFDVVDVRASVTLPQPTAIAHPVAHIEQFSAGMFGGRIYLPKAHSWDFGAASNTVTLRAEKWQLADIVALQQNQDIHAQGELEGELPISVAGGRIIIGKGYLRATPSGGSIRYIANEASEALAERSEELGLALDLLNDFKYEILSSKVELDPQGNLLLGLSLTGKNPAYYEGRQIQFNINLEQNLDPLLQSLRLSDNLVEQLESGLR